MTICTRTEKSLARILSRTALNVQTKGLCIWFARMDPTDWYKALNEGMSRLAAVQAMEQGSYPGQCTATWHDCMVI